MKPELVIIILNLVVVLLTYYVIYPVFAGRNIKKLIINDFCAMIVSLSIAGALYSNAIYEFNMLITETNWFWFCISTYLVIETPFAQRYIKKMGLF